MFSILQREMRIASRRPWTFRIRVLTSVLAFVIGFFLVLLSTTGGATGDSIFNVLTFFTFWFCLIQGVRRASGSISDEKREGTLGLLFLTDLRPLDIVVGKLCSIAIPLIQPLLAFVPVLAISILLGGTTGGEILRATLVMGSVLVFSIATGLFVSSQSRKSTETGHGTLFLLLGLVAIPWWISWGPLAPVRFLSPWSAFATISDPGYRVNARDFIISILVMNGLSGALLLGAAFFLPRRWEDRPVVSGETRIVRRSRISPEKRAAILDRNPGEWLAVRHSMGTVESRFFAVLIVLLGAGAGLAGATAGMLEGAASVFLFLGGLLMTLRIASQASYPLAEARRSGAIEMLTSTPMRGKSLINGQVVALRNQFLPLIGVLLIASIFTVTGTRGLGTMVGTAFGVVIYWGMLLLTTCTVAAFGMWMGLREKSPNAAFFKTILFTVVLPFPLLCFWIVVPIGYIILLLLSIGNLTGRSLDELLKGERQIELTPVTPVVVAPPVIAQQR